MLREVPACIAAGVALQLWLMRWAGAPARLSFLVALAAVVAAWQLPVAVLLEGRRNDRPWALTLLLVPGVLAAMPVARRMAGGIPAMLALAVAVVLLGSVRLRRPGAPFACAVAGAILGWAVGFAALRWNSIGAVEIGGVLPAERTTGLIALSAASILALAVAFAQPVHRALSEAGRPAAAFVHLLVAAAALTTPRQPSRARESFAKDRPPVVLVVLDTLRADHLRSYGYARDTMPALERFAARHALRFERSLASAGASLPSHASMFTGLRPSRHGGHPCDVTVDPNGPYLHPVRGDVPTAAQLLRRAGYWTVGISANYSQLAPELGAGRGFEWYDATPGWQLPASRLNPYRGPASTEKLKLLDRWYPFSDRRFFSRPQPGSERNAKEIVDLASSALHRAGSDSFFLFLNLFDSHQPYRSPLSHRRFSGRASRIENLTLDGVVKGHPATKREVRAAVDAYDDEITFLDSQLDRLLGALEAHPRFPEMLILVIGDHGEAFGEHGVFDHGTSAYDESLRVPLFVKPGRRHPFEPGSVSTRPFQSVDVFPTILDHARLPVPPGIDGVAWGAGRAVSSSEVYACRQQDYGNRFMFRMDMIEARPWKLILSSKGTRELYRTDLDADEERNVIAQEPEVAEQLEAASRTMQGDRARTDPSYRLPSSVVDSLRALGYLN